MAGLFRAVRDSSLALSGGVLLVALMITPILALVASILPLVQPSNEIRVAEIVFTVIFSIVLAFLIVLPLLFLAGYLRMA